MAKVQFYLMDIMYKIIDGRAQIYMYGRTIEDTQICVIDKNFEPYFYAMVEGNVFIENEIKAINVPMNNGAAFATKIEAVKKKVMGKEANILKITANIPKAVPFLKEEIKKLKSVIEVFEYDILFVRRYLFDKQITPLCLVEAEGEITTERSRCPVLTATSIMQVSEDIIKPKILAIDIETYCKHQGNIDSKKDPIVMVALYGKGFKKVISYKNFNHGHDYLEIVKSEEALLKRFKELVNWYKPDVVTGYFSDGFDFPYIKDRADKYNINMDISLDYSTLKIESRGNKTATLTGLVHLDVFRFIRRVVGRSLATDSYSLENVAQELLGTGKHPIDIGQLAYHWDEGSDELAEYAKYNLIDAQLTHDVLVRVLPNLIELCKIIRLPIADVSRMSFSQLVEWFITNQTVNANEVILNKPSYTESAKRNYDRAKGAFVYEPTPGVYNQIAIFDFRSLYPSILVSHNISHDTLNCKCCKDAEKVPLEGRNYWYCKKKTGFLSSILGEIINRRQEVKQLIKASDKPDRLLMARSEALKVLANSFYGYLGFAPARWYCHECVESITAYGRHYIKQVIGKARELGFDVLYSDTDSVFLELKGKQKEDALDFAALINRKLPGIMELEFEGFYKSALFVSEKGGESGAKKKYALLDEKDNLTVKGFETVRRNWSFIAKEVQKEVLGMVMIDGNADRAMEHVKKTIHDMRENKVPLDKVVIRTALSKGLDAYTAIGPHVAAARRMAEKGIPVGAGSMITFIVCKGEGKIRDRVKLAEEASQNDYDAEYYINNQIIPSVERIFAVFGMEPEVLMSESSQKDLSSFF